MREDSRDVKASWAFHIHKERVRALDEPFQLMLSSLHLLGWMKKVDRHIYSLVGCTLWSKSAQSQSQQNLSRVTRISRLEFLLIAEISISLNHGTPS